MKHTKTLPERVRASMITAAGIGRPAGMIQVAPGEAQFAFETLTKALPKNSRVKCILNWVRVNS